MNFRVITKPFAALALVSVIMAVILWKELGVARAVTATLRTERGATASAAAGPGMTTPPGGADAAAPAGTRESKLDSTAAVTPTVSPPARPARRALSESELLKDPEYRKARATVLRYSIARTYPGLAEELGLSPEEANRFFGLLAEFDLERSSQSQLAVSPRSADPVAIAQQRERQQAQQQRENAAIQEMLGEARYPQWRDYQNTRSAHMQASNFANSLSQAGMPLSGDQNRALVAAVIAEQRRAQQELAELARNRNAADPNWQARYREAQEALRTNGNQRMLDAISAQLSPQQANAIRVQLEQEAAMRGASERARARTLRLQPPQ